MGVAGCELDRDGDQMELAEEEEGGPNLYASEPGFGLLLRAVLVLK